MEAEGVIEDVVQSRLGSLVGLTVRGPGRQQLFVMQPDAFLQVVREKFVGQRFRLRSENEYNIDELDIGSDAMPDSGSEAAQRLDLPLLGRKLVSGELVTRGARCVEEFTGLNRRMIRGRSQTGKQFDLIVKVRRSGTWQVSVTDGDPSKSAANTYWVFVDVESGHVRPKFFIVTDIWVREDILHHHTEYLARHGGMRAISPKSNHHALQGKRILQWEDRWDVLGLQ
jgi:hypothetical protein